MKRPFKGRGKMFVGRPVRKGAATAKRKTTPTFWRGRNIAGGPRR